MSNARSRHRSIGIATTDTAPLSCVPAGHRTARDASRSAMAPRTHSPICATRCRTSCRHCSACSRASVRCAIELHHLVGHHPAVLELLAGLGVPYDLHVHDYAWLCGRVALVGPAQRYCGEPEVAQCEACVADAGNLIDEDITVAALRRRSAALMARARARDRAIGGCRIAHPPPFPEDASGSGAARGRCGARRSAAVDRRPRSCRVCVIGAIGIHKGYQVVLDCASRCSGTPSAAGVRRGGPHDRRPQIARHRTRLHHRRLRTRRGCGPDQGTERDAGAAAVDLAGDLVLRACRGLAGRIARGGVRHRRAGRTHPRAPAVGFLLPLGLPAHAINNALMAAIGLSYANDSARLCRVHCSIFRVFAC